MSSKGAVPIEKTDPGVERARTEETPIRQQHRMGWVLDKIFELTLERQARIGSFIPRVDLVETDGIIKVSAELPGMSEKEVEVTLNPDALLIKGEKIVECEQDEKNLHRRERSQGRFFRRIELPAEVDVDKVDAVFSRGVLNITLHKARDARAKKVKLRAET